MIFVSGGRSKQRNLAFKASSFAWMRLMPRITRCEVNIELKKIIGYEGTCIDTDDREFHLEIDKRLKGDEFLTTIFHEMVHVKQLIKKEFFTELNFYKDREEYLNMPWEVEAYRVQEELLNEWKSRRI